MLSDDIISGLKIGDDLIFGCNHPSCSASKNCSRMFIRTIADINMNQNNDVIITINQTFVPACCSLYRIGEHSVMMPKYYGGTFLFL